MEVNNREKGSRVAEIVSSTISWPSLHMRIAEILNVYQASLHVQYRFSTESKDSLPCDLTSQQHLDTMIRLLRALVVPPLTKSGRPSAKKMKSVTVQIFNRSDEPHQGKHGPGKVCKNMSQ
jgi:hypothetical protein